MPPIRPLAGLVGLSLICGGCQDGAAALRQARLDLGLGQRPVEAPGFLAASRRADDGYLPVGVDAPRPSLPPRNAAGLKSLQDDLERARIRNEEKGRAADALGRAAGPAPVAP